MTNNKHALLIGINNYHLLSDLKYARQDAEAFSEALQEYCGFSEEDITLMSCDASGACQAQSIFIERALTSLTDYRNLDLLVFGFWGHGFAPEAGKRYLCGTHTLEDELERTAVSLDVVKAKLSQVGAENTLMILDCCQNRPGGRGGTSETLSRGEEQSFASMARDIQAASVGKHSKYTVPTVAILNACREGQKAYEWDKKQHGIFTAHLLNTLSSGCTSVSRLAHSVFGPVAKTADELYRQKQTPYVVIEGQGDILLVSSGYSDEKSISAKSRPPRKTKSPSIIWWLDEDKQIPESELIALIKNGELTGSTEVWRAGLDDWVELKEVPELSQHISSSPPSRSKKPSALTHKNGDIMTVPELGMELVYVEPGRFMMGSDDEVSCGDEQPVHEVTITRGYWLGKYPVTQEEYKQIMGVNPSYFKGGNHPVEKVSWNDAVKFCKKLTEREQAAGRLPSGYEYRLPTEAEWEFAARGGTKSCGYKYSGSDNIGSVAWYDDNSDGKTHEVGTKSANELGIYDMSGNVLECCNDWYGDYFGGSVTDSTGASSGSNRVARGGCWFSSARFCRSANRSWFTPSYRYDCLGFRLARITPVNK